MDRRGSDTMPATGAVVWPPLLTWSLSLITVSSVGLGSPPSSQGLAPPAQNMPDKPSTHTAITTSSGQECMPAGVVADSSPRSAASPSLPFSSPSGVDTTNGCST